MRHAQMASVDDIGPSGRPRFATRGLRTIIDTSTMGDGGGVEYWHDLGSKLYVAHQPHIAEAKSFSAKTNFASSSGIDVSIVRMTPAVLERQMRHVRTDESDRCFFCMLLCGDISFIQDGREIRPAVNQVFLVDSRRPYQLIYHTPSRLLHYTVTASEIERRLGPAKSRTAIVSNAELPIGSIAAQVLWSTASTLEFSEHPRESRLLDIAVDLAALALDELEGGGRVLPSSTKDVALERLHAAIRKNLSNPELSPQTVAEQAGISVRYANKLLGESGTSLMRQVQSLRLEECARILANSDQNFRRITEIAFSLGFNDLSNFSKSFKQKFGVTPREYRENNKNKVNSSNKELYL